MTRWKVFFAKIFQYEYWAWWVFYLPMLPYWLYWVARTKSWAYFSAVNPGIELGGFFGESKKDILDKIDKTYLPAYFLVENISFEELLTQLSLVGISFPIIAKPNVGERGEQVAKILTIEELRAYHNKQKTAYIIQEFIDFEVELGVLYVRMPQESTGQVTSITAKRFLKVQGNGKNTIRELMQKDVRSFLQIKRLEKILGEAMNVVPAENEEVLLEPIGNHCRGTMFLNYNHLISQQINHIFDKIAANIEGFYYGRFDLKVKSLEDFQNGKNIKIVELNGVSSEPGHIYDPSYTLWKAYRDLAFHWSMAGQIATQNIKRGVRPASFKEIIKIVYQHFFNRNPKKKPTKAEQSRLAS